ncbi:MAG: DUF2760 domain-containing protein [Thermoguttaceae bacterium]
MRVLLAFRVFFVVLFNRPRAERIAAELEAAAAPKLPPPAQPAVRALPARSEAVTLLAALQREARFVDFIMESLDGLPNERIGAAARDVQRACRSVIERMFALEPVLRDEEQSLVEVPPGFDSGKYRLTGNVTGEPPYRGRLMHPGWKAARCDVPKWSGSDEAARVIAPAEVELS